MINENWIRNKEIFKDWINEKQLSEGNKETLEKKVFASYYLEKLTEPDM
ncbi:MAG: hypothetical protein LBV58_01600 [Acholeplasmatales bacterium]|jgi:hypothetical protein|nr:hypothetical protein [Acholeplasmatales bacterium]